MEEKESGMKGGMAGMLGSLGGIKDQLAGLDYPKKKDEIIEYARKAHIPDNIIQKLEGIADRVYNSADDVTQEVSKHI